MNYDYCNDPALVSKLADLEKELAVMKQLVGDWHPPIESDVEPSGNTLIDRLRGIYVIPVNDGAGPLNGSNEFTRRFAVGKINLEAAEEILRLRKALATQQAEIQQILGKALGYPWFKDDQKNFPGATEENGVCVGEHVAETLAMEAAAKITELKRKVEELEHFRPMIESWIRFKAQFPDEYPGAKLALDMALSIDNKRIELETALTAAREKLREQAQAQQQYTDTIDREIRNHFRHFGYELPKIDGPIWQAVTQFVANAATQRLAAIDVKYGKYDRQQMTIRELVEKLAACKTTEEFCSTIDECFLIGAHGDWFSRDNPPHSLLRDIRGLVWAALQHSKTAENK